MRTLARLGVAEELLPKLHVQRNYEWRNAAGELLIEHDFAETGRSGWAEWYMMYQPELEDALDRRAREAGVDVRFDSPVAGLADHGDHVEFHVGGREPHRVRARWVIACDGGNSFVRSALGLTMEDYGFSEPWMVCDFRFRDAAAAHTVPTARQVGDPAGPTSIISLGPAHHRFSYMLDSVEDFDVERDPEKVWARTTRWLSRDDAELIRVATYTFRSLVTDRWRVGRVLLAGDAAHQMPPFLGQGMCSGIRDAQNIAFKLDAVLRGRLADDVLDTYQQEREPHVRAVIEKGIELGRQQTVRDPERAAERDRVLLGRRAANQKPDTIRFPGLVDGLLATASGPGRGELAVQGVVDDGTVRDRLDQVVGTAPTCCSTPAASPSTRTPPRPSPPQGSVSSRCIRTRDPGPSWTASWTPTAPTWPGSRPSASSRPPSVPTSTSSAPRPTPTPRTPSPASSSRRSARPARPSSTDQPHHQPAPTSPTSPHPPSPTTPGAPR